MFVAGPPLFIVVFGIVWIAAACVFAALRYRKTNATVTRLVDLALGGRSDEARIHARNESSEIGPLLDALGGDLVAPRPRPMLKDVLLMLAVPIPVLALGFYGWSAIGGGGETKVAVAASVLVGLAVLIPLSFAGAFAILVLGRHAGRLVRGSCVTILARSVKAAIEAETAEALRRGANVRDPRME